MGGGGTGLRAVGAPPSKKFAGRGPGAVPN
jgi:hypothetical protein